MDKEFFKYECTVCGFTSVLDHDKEDECPLCAGDSGHSNIMQTSLCTPDTGPVEGRDMRDLEAEARRRG